MELKGSACQARGNGNERACMPSRKEWNGKGLHAKQEGMELKGPAYQAGGNGIERACIPSRREWK